MQVYDTCHSMCPLVCGSAAGGMCAGGCVADHQCDTNMWWDDSARRHSDSNGYAGCEQACNAPPSAIGAGDGGVCYITPSPCEACTDLCNAQIDASTQAIPPQLDLQGR